MARRFGQFLGASCVSAPQRLPIADLRLATYSAGHAGHDGTNGSLNRALLRRCALRSTDIKFWVVFTSFGPKTHSIVLSSADNCRNMESGSWPTSWRPPQKAVEVFAYDTRFNSFNMVVLLRARQ